MSIERPALPTSPSDAQQQLTFFEKRVVSKYARMEVVKRRYQSARAEMEQARDDLMMVKLTATGAFGPSRAVGSNGSWRVEDAEEAALVERRRYFPSTDLGQRALSELMVHRAVENGVAS